MQDKSQQIINALKNINDTVSLCNSDKQSDIELFHDTHTVLQNLPFKYRQFIFNKYGLKLTYKQIEQKTNERFDNIHYLSKRWKDKVRQTVKSIFQDTPQQYIQLVA